MGIHKMMTNGIFTINGEHTHNHKTKISDYRSSHSCKPFEVIDESECFVYNSLIYSLSYRLHTTARILRVKGPMCPKAF